MNVTDLSVLVGVAEVVLCSEDHAPKESQQRYVIYHHLCKLESVMELWGIGYGSCAGSGLRVLSR